MKNIPQVVINNILDYISINSAKDYQNLSAVNRGFLIGVREKLSKEKARDSFVHNETLPDGTLHGIIACEFVGEGMKSIIGKLVNNGKLICGFQIQEYDGGASYVLSLRRDQDIFYPEKLEFDEEKHHVIITGDFGKIIIGTHYARHNNNKISLSQVIEILQIY